MGSLKNSYRQALLYMPQHLARQARTQNLTLDALLEERRLSQGLDAGALDLILMGYRLSQPFAQARTLFQKRPLKPRLLEDLWMLAYGALLTRDQTPPAALVSEAVELSGELFGSHTKSLTNAFLRQSSRERPHTLQKLEADPSLLLSPELRERWASSPELLQKAGQQLLVRPPQGISCFDAAAHFDRRASQDFLASQEPLQAMNAGSWSWITFLTQTLKDSTPLTDQQILLDACAAPGGKLLALLVQNPQLLAPPDSATRIWATDASYPRLERLRSNLQRWKKQSQISAVLWDWTQTGVPDKSPEHYDLILADLPCSGSGTLASRPDLLLRSLTSRVRDLSATQTQIIEHLHKRVAPGGHMAVSLCSVDPEEIAHLSQLLRQEPSFHSWKGQNSDAVNEGLVGWLIPARC